ncbi:hypothetical protein [Rhizobium lusitanum]|uniref:Uncharacterized protein n=1 Tax=Rhizobium lusitanum TaxID=293958 RepID=A0A7X0IUW3_9HYPH|nr:hypothetical protein [Rhizobium lusitanum]MBB6487062.1 hypothetical protein [Rhizobium lusitanum]
MMKRKFLFLPICCGVLAGAFGQTASAGDVGDALAARNPVLAELRKYDAKAFDAAVAIIAKSERSQGIAPGVGLLPQATSPGRDMGKGLGQEFTSGNPDVLWLYNSSSEGMNDLISILKTAGQKPKS